MPMMCLFVKAPPKYLMSMVGADRVYVAAQKLPANRARRRGSCPAVGVIGWFTVL